MYNRFTDTDYKLPRMAVLDKELTSEDLRLYMALDMYSLLERKRCIHYKKIKFDLNFTEDDYFKSLSNLVKLEYITAEKVDYGDGETYIEYQILDKNE